ncbi:hypothetical protein RU639_007108 [Aspergillus parasiticus]
MSVTSIIFLGTFSSNRRGSGPAGVEDSTRLRDLSSASPEVVEVPTDCLAVRRTASSSPGHHWVTRLQQKSLPLVSLNNRAHKNAFLSSGWAATKLTLFSMTASPALFVAENCKFCKFSATHNLGQKNGSCGYESGFAVRA